MPEDDIKSRICLSSSGLSSMRCVKRASVTDSFLVKNDEPIPEIPKGGARIRVCYAGACYTDQQVKNSGQHTLKSPGVHDTSLFPGYEVSGVIDEFCNTVTSSSHFSTGDRVILYPDNQQVTNTGFEEYISVSNLENLIKVPESLSLDVAALLPCGALTAYTAILRAKPYVEQMINASNETVSILVVGAGGLGLWTIQMANCYISGENKNKVHVTVADTCVSFVEEKLYS